MREKKISTNIKAKHHSKNFILNVSILGLFIINSILAYTLIDKISFKNNDDNYSADSTAERIQVEVLNGCGVSGVAERLTDFLRSNNVDVVNLGNYRSFEIENSIIIGRNEKLYNAEKVAAIVGLDKQNVIQQINPDYLLDVTFILGKDYKDLIPLKKR